MPDFIDNIIQRYASHGGENLHSFYASELATLQTKIHTLENTITERIRHRLRPNDQEISPLQFGAVQVNPERPMRITDQHYLLFRQDGIASCFSPISDTTYFPCKIGVRIDQNSIRLTDTNVFQYALNKDESEAIYGRVFLGLSATPNTPLNILFTPPKSAPNLDFSLCTFWQNGQQLFAKPYTNSYDSVTKPGPQSLRKFNLIDQATEAFRTRLFSVSVPEAGKVPPIAIQALIDCYELPLEEAFISHWIEIRFPAHLAAKAPDIRLDNNVVPVLEGRLKQWSTAELDHQEDIVISLQPEGQEELIYIDNIRGNEAKPYQEITCRPFSSSSAGSWEYTPTKLDSREDKLIELQWLLLRGRQLCADLHLDHPNDNNWENIVRAFKQLANTPGISLPQFPSGYCLSVRPMAQNEQIRVHYRVKTSPSRLPNFKQIGTLHSGPDGETLTDVSWL